MNKKKAPFNLQVRIFHDKARNDKVALRVGKRNKFNKSVSNTPNRKSESVATDCDRGTTSAIQSREKDDSSIRDRGAVINRLCSGGDRRRRVEGATPGVEQPLPLPCRVPGRSRAQHP